MFKILHKVLPISPHPYGNQKALSEKEIIYHGRKERIVLASAFSASQNHPLHRCNSLRMQIHPQMRIKYNCNSSGFGHPLFTHFCSPAATESPLSMPALCLQHRPCTPTCNNNLQDPSSSSPCLSSESCAQPREPLNIFLNIYTVVSTDPGRNVSVSLCVSSSSGTYSMYIRALLNRSGP